MQGPHEFIGPLHLRPCQDAPTHTPSTSLGKASWGAPSIFSPPTQQVCTHPSLVEVLGLCYHPTARAHTNCSNPKIYINFSILKLLTTASLVLCSVRDPFEIEECSIRSISSIPKFRVYKPPPTPTVGVGGV